MRKAGALVLAFSLEKIVIFTDMKYNDKIYMMDIITFAIMKLSFKYEALIGA